jgi:hypothetical protein
MRGAKQMIGGAAVVLKRQASIVDADLADLDIVEAPCHHVRDFETPASLGAKGGELA